MIVGRSQEDGVPQREETKEIERERFSSSQQSYPSLPQRLNLDVSKEKERPGWPKRLMHSDWFCMYREREELRGREIEKSTERERASHRATRALKDFVVSVRRTGRGWKGASIGGNLGAEKR
jgi:hypothetical protein